MTFSLFPLGGRPMRPVSIQRDELVRLVDEASREGCADSTRAKLLTVAETTDAVAVGWFHCDGVLCPASQAKRRNQVFQRAFDIAMSARFGRVTGEPFVVRVSGRAGAAQATEESR